MKVKIFFFKQLDHKKKENENKTNYKIVFYVH